jgi:TonB family protein
LLKRIIPISLLCALALSNNAHSSTDEFPRDEARLAKGGGSIDDSSLSGNTNYQKWKRAFLETDSGRALWGKWSAPMPPTTVHITMGENGGGVAGAETKDFVFDGGKLIRATIVLGEDFGKRAPRNAAAYPVLSALDDRDYYISREAKAVGMLAHEFGHVEHARRIGGDAFLRQERLLIENKAGFIKYGWDWFERIEYRRIVAELGAAPFDVVRQREIGAEASAVPVILDYFRGKMPATVQQAIRSYREENPLSLAPDDMKRAPVSALDAELPRLSFSEWFGKVVGPDAGIIWQLSECGERGEDSLNTPGDMRACVEANAMLPDGRRVILMTAVGTFKRGVTGAPVFYFGVIEQEGELYLIKRLRDLPKQLSTPRSFARIPSVELPDLRPVEVRLAPSSAPVPPVAWIGDDSWQAEASEDIPPPPARPPRPRTVSANDGAEGLRILGAVSWGDVISKAQPRYPTSAKKFNISGPVDVQVTISDEGRVIKAKAISGHPLLQAAAVEAARQWVFRPATLKGVAVETQIVLTFVFKAPQ